MAGNVFPTVVHSTFEQKVKNFPDDIYNFNAGDNITTLMSILLGNSGTGQLRNLQLVARLGQQNMEFSNLDTIMGLILNVKRASSEIYSFATNPFIDQLTDSQWQEISVKDSAYRERLMGAAEAFQIGATLWGVLTLCEALTQIKFYAVESWRSPGYGRGNSGINQANEIVLIPLMDSTNNSGFWQWNQSQKETILQVINRLVFANFVISFGNPVQTMTNVPLSAATTTDTPSQYFHLKTIVTANSLNTPGAIIPGASSRYWLKNGANSEAPHFAHLQTQESVIDLTGNINYVSSSDVTGFPEDSVASSSLQVTSTVYGAQ
jgi:hypothetical protein